MPITKKLNKLKLTLLLLSLLSLLSCTNPPDVPVFEDLGTHMGKNPVNGHIEIRPSPTCEKQIQEPACGHGVFTMSQKQIYVGEKKEHWFNGKPWSQLKAESVYLPAKESYAPMASYIINMCAKNNCSQDVDRFKVRLDELKNIGTLTNGMF